MIHSLVRKRNALLTTVVLSALSLPAYAADADADPLQVKTDAIVVTASRTEQMLRESPASAEVITRKDIDRMGAENLVQALRLAAGIDVRENGMVGNQSAIRGLSTNQTLILIDGRIWTMLTASRSCAVRRAHFTARMHLAASSTSSERHQRKTA